MTSEHGLWLDQAVELARVKRYDEAREFALRVLREDGRNAKALWVIASVTESLAERRNALRALLRIQPENLQAQRMLISIDREAKTIPDAPPSSTVIRSIKPVAATQHVLLYAVIALAALLIVAAAVAVAAGV